MKTILPHYRGLLLGFCLVLSLSAWGQTQKIKRSDVPPRLFSKFTRLFPNSAGLPTTVWEKDGANYTLSYTKKGQVSTATLDPNGKTLSMRAAIRLDQLPNDVFCYLEDNYRRYFEDSAMRIVDIKGDETYEVVVFRYESDKTTLLFDDRGRFLSIKPKK